MDRATPAATAHLRALHSNGTLFRLGWDALTIAAIGLGGGPNGADPARVAGAARRLLGDGINLLDAQENEAAVGQGLADALAAGDVRRDQVVVCAQGGSLPPDTQALIDARVLNPGDVVDGHCLAPLFLRHQIKRSLSRLRVTCLDLYWLHGVDAHRAALREPDFRLRLREALAALEVAAVQNEIAAFGLSLRDMAFPPELALEAAHDVLGERHHLRAVKLNAEAQPHSTAHLAARAVELGLHVVAVGLEPPMPGVTAALLDATTL